MRVRSSFFQLLLALFLTSLVLVACDPFVEGPSFSFKTAETRLVNTWRVKEAAQNGVEITALFKDGFFNFKPENGFSTVDTKKLVSLPPFTQDTILPIAGTGSWFFLQEKNMVELIYTYTFQDPYNVDVVYSEEAYEQWEIRRLTKDELWMRNDSVIMKLVPFNN
jgi:hypothetical protein